MSGAVACTIAADNYMPYVRVLAQSFRAHNPGMPFQVLLVAHETRCQAAEREGMAVIRLRDLEIPVLSEMLRRYGRKQICAALKPSLLRHLLESGNKSVVFLDPDILVTGSLAPVFTSVAGHALSLTPHILSPPGQAGRERFEKSLLMSGLYNAGFIGVSDRDEARQFLSWWETRLRTHCREAPKAGYHYDQRWLDHALGFVRDLHVLRDAGCNAAYWNLGNLEWQYDGSGYRANGLPLRFFHFSGFDPAEPNRISRYASGWTVDQLGPEGNLFRHYAELLRGAGWRNRRWLRGKGMERLRRAIEWVDLGWRFSRPTQ